MSGENKKTPLYERHKELGGKMVDYFGWALPVQYTGIIEEHRAVRERAGIFDVSHMGEIEIIGPDAFPAVQMLIANNAKKLEDGKVLYTPICYHDGGVVDDLLVYRYGEDNYLLVVNAANKDKDYQWIKENLSKYEVDIVDKSYEIGQLAIQGPEAENILQKVYNEDLSQIKFFRFSNTGSVGEYLCTVSRTGYTGEDGFEIYCKSQDTPGIFDLIMEAGKDFGLAPCGLGCRDTLRFEAGMPLYGHELSPEINPLEAGMKIFVDLEKDNFIGCESLQEVVEEGVKRKIIGIEMLDRGIPRQGYPIEVSGEEIGTITSGTFSPTLEKNLGIGLVNREYSEPDKTVDVRIRKRLLRGKTVKLPFYKRKRR